MQIVLFEPEIPPNTGNVARLCAATNVPLHLIEPLGFKLENRYLKRAGLDYWPKVELQVWPNFQAFISRESKNASERYILTSSKKRELSQPLQNFAFKSNDCLVFGPETRGLPNEILDQSPFHVRVPMSPNGARCINLSTCVGIVLYQALISCGIPRDWD
ncbi:MAG: tRNA (cytidine(34)-2'-O)-methyltransferase [Desulfovibrionaceae bacterium]|nr:tRNA (cytidine(34)-2'-O)-methyltransferase [Desulfovibrionaceae bacterium]